jgi:hypothetical protein
MLESAALLRLGPSPPPRRPLTHSHSFHPLPTSRTPPKMLSSLALLALAAASPAVAQLSLMRATSEFLDASFQVQNLTLLLLLLPYSSAPFQPSLYRSPTLRTACFRSPTFTWSTVPGALHQCENTNVVFFQTGSDRPLDLLFLPSSSVPDSLRTGTTTIEEAIAYNPLQAIDGITTADNAAYDFELQIAEGTVFEVSFRTASSRPETRAHVVILRGRSSDSSPMDLARLSALLAPS